MPNYVTVNGYFFNCKLGTRPGVYVIGLSAGSPAAAPSFVGWVDSTSLTNIPITQFKKGDKVEADIDSMTSKIARLECKSVSTSATGSANLRPKRQLFTATVHFYSYDLTPSGRFLGTIEVTLDPPTVIGVKRHSLGISNTSILAAGLMNLKMGDQIYIEYYDDGELRLLDLPSEKDSKPAVIEEKPADWVNLCVQQMMFMCGTEVVKERGNCHFWSRSSSRMNDCCYFRESVGGACDCVAAHAHLREFGNARSGVTVVKKEPEKSWDQMQKERFGRTV